MPQTQKYPALKMNSKISECSVDKLSQKKTRSGKFNSKVFYSGQKVQRLASAIFTSKGPQPQLQNLLLRQRKTNFQKKLFYNNFSNQSEIVKEIVENQLSQEDQKQLSYNQPKVFKSQVVQSSNVQKNSIFDIILNCQKNNNYHNLGQSKTKQTYDNNPLFDIEESLYLSTDFSNKLSPNLQKVELHIGRSQLVQTLQKPKQNYISNCPNFLNHSNRSSQETNDSSSAKLQQDGSNSQNDPQSRESPIKVSIYNNENTQVSLQNKEDQQNNNHYTIINKIGEGLHAEIFLASRQNNELICLKVFKQFNETSFNSEEEYRISQLPQGHPNIVQIFKFERQQPIYIPQLGILQKDFLVMEYCPNADLFELMSTYSNHRPSGQKGLIVQNETLLKQMIRQLSEAVMALHYEAGLAHMDIKLENVLINETGDLKMCDFSFSIPIQSFVDRRIGTPLYQAPELYFAQSIPCKAQPTDIFSLGVVFFILAFGVPPFHSAEQSDPYFNLLKFMPNGLDFFKYHPHTKQLYQNNKISQSLMQLLIEMLKAEPTQRLQDVSLIFDFDYLKDQPFINSDYLSSNQELQMIKQDI